MKYELTNQTMIIKRVYEDVTLHRIRALKSFGNVKAGDLGGWIEKEENLSQKSSAWVYDDAIVMDDAKVVECAKAYENAVIYNNAIVAGRARVCGHAEIFDNAFVYEFAKVSENARVYKRSRVCGHAKVYGKSFVDDLSFVFGNAEVFEDAVVSGNVIVGGKAKVHGQACISKGCFYGNANLRRKADAMYVGPIGPNDEYATFMRTTRGIAVYIGGSFGPVDKVIEALSEWIPSYRKPISLAAELAKEQIKLP